jgi:hypothetical protein
MTSQDYRLALDAAMKEYEDLGQQKRALDDRLAQLGQTVGSLTRLLGLTPTVPLGLTDACRMILRRGDPMTPVEVRNRLLAIGIDMSKYANDLAAVHTILKRLSASGELRFISGAAGKHQYAWNQPTTSAGLSKDIVSASHDAAHEREAMRVTVLPDDSREDVGAGRPSPARRAKRRPKKARK